VDNLSSGKASGYPEVSEHEEFEEAGHGIHKKVKYIPIHGMLITISNFTTINKL
jgi:hypothetical protein